MANTGNNSRNPAFHTYGGAPTFAADLTEIAGTAAAVIGESYASVVALPASGNWEGRTALVTGVGYYTWTADAWKPSILIADTGWIDATMANSWTSDGTQTVGYRRLNGIVYLRGRGTGGTTGTAFTLPVGFRPNLAMLVGVMSGASTTPTLTRVVINPDGTVSLIAGAQPNFDGINFPADD